MNQYLYRIQPTRPAMLSEGPTPEEAAAVGAHFGYLQDLVDTGKVLMAGRTLTTDERSFGIVVFEASSEEAAQALVEADPAVKAEVMRAELFPYRVALWSKFGPSGAESTNAEKSAD